MSLTNLNSILTLLFCSPVKRREERLPQKCTRSKRRKECQQGSRFLPSPPPARRKGFLRTGELRDLSNRVEVEAGVRQLRPEGAVRIPFPSSTWASTSSCEMGPDVHSCLCPASLRQMDVTGRSHRAELLDLLQVHGLKSQ